MIKAMMIIAMVGGVNVDTKSEYETMQECKVVKQIIINQDEDAKVYCVPVARTKVDEVLDRFMKMVKEMQKIGEEEEQESPQPQWFQTDEWVTLCRERWKEYEQNFFEKRTKKCSSITIPQTVPQLKIPSFELPNAPNDIRG